MNAVELYALSGAQGTGKTTLLRALKKDSHLIDHLTFIDSPTRQLAAQGYGINKAGDDATQLEIMRAHLQNVRSFDGTRSMFLDRCALDGYVYSLWMEERGLISPETLEQVHRVFMECAKRYDVVFYLPPEFSVQADGIRDTDVRFRDEIASLFQRSLDTVGRGLFREVIYLHGSVKERLDVIYSVIQQGV